MATPCTLDPQEPMLQQAALQVVLELLLTAGRTACLQKQCALLGRKTARLHIPPVLPPNLVQRVAHRTQRAHPGRLHQRLEGVLPRPRHVLLPAEQRLRLVAVR